jgi:hypothetical protein
MEHRRLHLDEPTIVHLGSQRLQHAAADLEHPAGVGVDDQVQLSLAEALFGLRSMTLGEISVEGRAGQPPAPNLAIQRGIGFVRVVRKGYLMPFGHAASLVKVTERKFHNVVQVLPPVELDSARNVPGEVLLYGIPAAVREIPGAVYHSQTG